MRDRVKHLETLVKDVLAPNSGEAKGNKEQGSGVVVMKEGESRYVGATHWAAILEDVCYLPLLTYALLV